MRRSIIVLFLLSSLVACRNTKPDYESRIAEHRRSIDELFSNEKTSPLSEEDRRKFTGLSYYSIDRNFLVPCRIEKFDSLKLVEISHTLNRKYPFIRWGKAHFRLYNDSFELTIYLSADKDTATNKTLFIPFKDETNAKETYAGGRYLDLNMSELNAIDFNLAYNPNCAYSDNWSCPLVPDENILHAPVKAGVKAFLRLH